MARRHKKSKTDVVQVNPDAVFNYVTGILTSGSKYINGILEGASLYNGWVTQEMSLEGKPIGEYKPGALRTFLDTIKKENPRIYYMMISNPKQFFETFKNTLPTFLQATNYGRLAQVDKYMIEAGKNYRELYPSLLKSKSREAGLTYLQTNLIGPEQISIGLGNLFKSKEIIK